MGRCSAPDCPRSRARQSFIGMAGPAMIEGGGLGKVRPDEIGPIEVQSRNGVVDLAVEDEAEATAKARQLLSYVQGPVAQFEAPDAEPLRDALPADRRFSYKARPVIEHVVDVGSFLELRRAYGGSVITGFARSRGALSVCWPTTPGCSAGRSMPRHRERCRGSFAHVTLSGCRSCRCATRRGLWWGPKARPKGRSGDVGIVCGGGAGARAVGLRLLAQGVRAGCHGDGGGKPRSARLHGGVAPG